MPVAIEFDAGAHTYRLNGRAVPGVTSVLEPLQMLDGIPWEVLEHARVRGQHVHEACHLHNLGGLEWDSLEDEVAGYVRGYLKFLAESSFVMLASETRVGSPKYGFCGTLDLYGLLRKARRRWTSKRPRRCRAPSDRRPRPISRRTRKPLARRPSGASACT
jgi:hypothetical protein